MSINNMGKKWTQQEDLVLIDNYDILSCHDLSIKLNRTVQSIFSRANKILNINKQCRYNKNQLFFRNYTLQNCYWAGFLAADGCISKPTELQIILSIKDIGHLRKFKKHIDYTGKIKTNKDICRLLICSKDIVNDLGKNFNIYAQKTFNLLPPKLNGDFALAYITGYIDGDGCIGYYKHKKNKNYIYNYYRLHITGTYNLLKWISDQLNLIYKSKFVCHNISTRTNTSVYQYQIVANKAKAVLLRLNNVSVPKLERKWGIINCLNGEDINAMK
jgi:hypothetical protein